MTPREIRFAIDGFTGIVVVSVAAAFASFTWTIAGYANSAGPVSAAATAYIPPAPAPDLTAVVNLPPFGRAVVAGPAAGAVTDLVLHGILLANPATQSEVLIAASGQKPVAYRVGQTLPGGRIIDSIAVDHVILRAGSQYLNLYFPDDERTAQAAAPAGAPPTTVSPPIVGLPGGPAPGAQPSGVEAMRALLPPNATGQVPPVQPPPTVAPVTPQNSGRGNGLIDRPPPPVTPRG